MQIITNSVSQKGGALATKIINKMSGLGKPRKKFMVHIMALYMCLRGRYVFKGLERYGDMCEKSYRLHFAKPFDFLGFNLSLCKETGEKRFILAFDPSFLPKSGKKTEGLAKFWSGCLGKAAPGLEAGVIAAIDLDGGGAYGLEAVLTPPPSELRAADKSLVDHYASVLAERAEKLKKTSVFLAVDAYFAKRAFLDPVTGAGFRVVSKLRADAALHYLYTGPQKGGRGRPRLYDGKADMKNIDKNKFVKVYEDGEKAIWEAVLWSRGLKRKIKVAYVEQLSGGAPTGRYSVLFSTDTELGGLLIYVYYKARFHIEFLFRDVKQHMGFAHCQARDSAKISFHINTVLASAGAAKAAASERGAPFSMSDVKTASCNEKMMIFFFSTFQVDPELQKNKELTDLFLRYGTIAA